MPRRGRARANGGSGTSGNDRGGKEEKGARRGPVGLPRKARLPLALVLLALLLLVAIASVMELAAIGRISRGIKIEGRPVEGLSRAGAARVARQVVTPLESDVTLLFEDRRFSIRPAEIGFRAEPEAMACVAYMKGRGGMMPARLFRRLFRVGCSFDVPVIFSYDRSRLMSRLAEIRDAVDREPRNARISVESGSPEIIDSRDGVRMKVEETRKAVEKALTGRERRAAVVAVSVKPEITGADVGTIILVSLSRYRLYLYDRENLVDYYAVAVGLPEYPTPTGKFHVYHKEKNPSWLPTGEWAKDKQGKLQPPGKDNPLGDYWFDLGSGIGIHGTPFVKSLGSQASHGCVRMRNEDAKVLFDYVKVGTPVFIVE